MKYDIHKRFWVNGRKTRVNGMIYLGNGFFGFEISLKIGIIFFVTKQKEAKTKAKHSLHPMRSPHHINRPNSQAEEQALRQ